MQESGVISMELVGRASPLAWGKTNGNRNERQAHGQPAASPTRTDGPAALKQAQVVHNQSLLMLVHELRAPAAASKSMAATLRYLNPHDVQLDGFLVRIEKRMDQLLDLVNDILDLSQAKAGPPLGQATELNLVEQTRTVCKPYQEDAAAKGLVMSVELPEFPVRARMEEKAYQLIVSNLVSNAVKYTPAGSVAVTLRKEGTWAVLVVQDTGIGIPPGEVEHLGTDFFRASNARESRAPGTGLGLAAVKALVEGYGGELELQSREGHGSTFAVRLPLQREAVAKR
jgi:signal transduction histidine kinase